MPDVEQIDSNVVYRNQNPGYHNTFACHSHIIELSAGELICAFQRGQALYSVDSVIATARSNDDGKTWKDQGLVYDPSGDERPYSYHGPYLTQMSDGALMMNIFRWDRSDSLKPVFNETTGGILESDTLLLESDDGGASWSDPSLVSPPDGLVITPSGPIVELAMVDGSCPMTNGMHSMSKQNTGLAP